jgi:hypothetical protein
MKSTKTLNALISILFFCGISCSRDSNKISLDEKWFLAGSAPENYQIGKDENLLFNERPVYYLKSISKTDERFGTIMNYIPPGESLVLFLGKRVKMTGMIKSENIDNHAGMWMRVDGPDPNKSFQFDNMSNRPIKGTSDWTKYEIVLDVPENSTGIAYGVLINGTGQVWLKDFSLEAVGNDVPTTDITDVKNMLDGWFKTGSKPDLFEIGKDENVKYNKSPSYYLKSLTEIEEGFGTITKEMLPDEFRGKRVRLTGVIKSEYIAHHAAMWMRVDGGDNNKTDLTPIL